MNHNRRTGISILGSTGSIGRQTLQVIDAHPERFRVVALAARSFSSALAGQIARYQPELVAVSEAEPSSVSLDCRLVTGQQGLQAAALHPGAEIVVAATSGHAALAPTIQALKEGKILALANKETLVCAGEIIMPLAGHGLARLRPVDSEHSAIWQSAMGAPLSAIERIILTASGGPFRTRTAGELESVTVADALAHPTWNMGHKITIDSATLMNKGLEVIEAHWLFSIPYERIDVVVHPESIIHSLVEFVDGAQIAQLGLPDMRLPIQFALTYPERLPIEEKRLRLEELGSLHFEPVDETRFPALRLARQAGTAGGTYPTVLSVADEVAVEAFVSGAIRFTDIPAIVSAVLDRHRPEPISLESIAATVDWAQTTAWEAVTRQSESG